MATLVTATLAGAATSPQPARTDPRPGATPLLLLILTVYAVAVHGFHPYAEDGGLYLAGVKALLHPGLFPADRLWVTAHLHYSAFAWVLAGVVRGTGASLDVVVLAGYVASVLATLGAAWALVTRCFTLWMERATAMLAFAAMLSMPIAGTSLLMVDPYLTARSVSTAAVLLLLAGVLGLADQQSETASRRVALTQTAAGVLTAVIFHPLMGALGLLLAVMLGSFLDGGGTNAPRTRLPSMIRALLLVAMVVAAAGLLLWLSPPETAAHTAAVMTRPCWFLSCWRWYEMAGLVMPVGVLAAAYRWGDKAGQRALGGGALAATGACLSVSFLFARADARSFAVARLQPMRMLQPVTCLVVLLLGGWLGRLAFGGTPAGRLRRWRCAGLSLILGLPCFLASCRTYPASPQVELAWAVGAPAAHGNAWVRAFVWTREHTPPDAIFALDAETLAREGEDAQGFRAIAERNLLPERVKDSGEAAITPSLSERWLEGVRAQTGLRALPDQERIRRLQPLGVRWLLLGTGDATQLQCPYRNEAAQVCRLP